MDEEREQGSPDPPAGGAGSPFLNVGRADQRLAPRVMQVQIVLDQGLVIQVDGRSVWVRNVVASDLPEAIKRAGIVVS